MLNGQRRTRPFATDVYSMEEANVIVFGVILGRRAAESVEAIRNASWFIETYDMELRKNLLENVKIYDIGNIEVKGYEVLDRITEVVSSITSSGKIPLMLGGGHLSTYFALKGLPTRPTLIVFDAHCDLRESYLDEKIIELDYMDENIQVDKLLNDATWLRHASDKNLFERAVVIGVRSGDEEQIEYAKRHGISLITPSSLSTKAGLVRIGKKLLRITYRSPVYISLDVDVFDPSFAPAVDHPEPGGIGFREFRYLVDKIKGRIVGIDAVCLRKIDGNEITEFLVARSLFHILSRIR